MTKPSAASASSQSCREELALATLLDDDEELALAAELVLVKDEVRTTGVSAVAAGVAKPPDRSKGVPTEETRKLLGVCGGTGVSGVLGSEEKPFESSSISSRNNSARLPVSLLAVFPRR